MFHTKVHLKTSPLVRGLSAPFALPHHYSVAHALFWSLSPCLTITRPSRSFSVSLALPHHYLVPHAHFGNLWSSHGPALSHYYSVPLALSHHDTGPLGPSRSFSLLLAITRSLLLHPALPLYFWPSHVLARSLNLLSLIVTCSIFLYCSLSD